MADTSREQSLHRRALQLEWFTVSWNIIEAVVAIAAGVIAGSTALIAFGADRSDLCGWSALASLPSESRG
jgi:hypothetical protein